ncbi:MAG TPA: adenylate/guanylate cyclase domain-containing protein [Ilumatobacteraceae bacterium]|nr:adenylate/guanylate cyclase domain-containing protein [Ilumatobacteraceae bacterium]
MHIAYQVIGAADPARPDLVLSYGYGSNVEAQWEQPRFAAFLDQLAELGRLVIYDKRDTGLSDRTGRPPTLEERVDDLGAVLEATGVDRAVMLGLTGGAPIAALFSALHPSRVEALVLYGAIGFQRVNESGAPATESDEPPAEFLEAVAQTWGTGITAHLYARSLVSEPGFVDWCAHYERSIASPGNAAAMVWMGLRWDLRPVLPAITAPTLVMWREGDLDHVQPEYYREVAELIPDARGVALPGTDHWPWTEHADVLLDEIRRFVVDRTIAERSTRQLGAVLFTDIVGSTEHAADAGDSRWRMVLERHDTITGTTVERFQGRVVKQTGDGVLAVFDGPGRSVACALELVDALRGIGVGIRAGVHMGEIETRGDDVSGLTVHIASRVCGEAGPGEVLVTRTMKDLLAGSRLTLEDRGTRRLKGVPDEWTVYAATR